MRFSSLARLLLPATLLAAPLHAQRSAGSQTDTIHLSIEDAVRRALSISDEVRLAAANTEVAEALITTSRASGLPQIRLNASYQQVLENARATIVGSVFGQNYNYNSTLNIQQSLFQGGRVFAANRAAGAVRRASALDEAETRSRVSVDVQRQYLEVLLARQLVRIQEVNLDLAEQRLRQVEQFEKAGRAARYDVLRARVERSNLEPALIQARSNVELAELALKRTVNVPPSQPLVTTSEPDLEGLEAFVARIVSDSAPDPIRASVRSAEFTLDARKDAIRVARADMLPTVNAFFNSGYLALPSSNGLPTIWGNTSADNCGAGGTAGRVCQNNGWFADRNFGVQISWPLFDGLRAKGNVDLAQAQARQAELQLGLERELVALERSASRAEYERARAAFGAQRVTVSEADEAIRLATLRFERGLGTLLETSDAQIALLLARVNQARAYFDLYIAAAELARARGVAVPLPPTRPLSR